MAEDRTPATLPFQYPRRWADLFDGADITPEGRARVAELEQRDRDLEDYLAGLLPFQTFNLTGPLTASRSDDWPTIRDWTLRRWVASLTTAGAADTVVDLLLSGTPVASLTIPAGGTIAYAELPPVGVTALFHRVAVEVTAAGAGAEGLVVQVFGT